MKTISLLGSTGSIGCNTLTIVALFPERLRIRALTAARNIERLAEQVLAFRPDLAVVLDADGAADLKRRLPSGTDVEILYGEEGYRAAATHPDCDTVVGAMVGAAGLLPTMAAIRAGKQIALANKETLVMAGEIVMQAAAEAGVDILPVDSEHSAIFQCLQGNRTKDVDRILLTASGGPFLERPAETFGQIGVADALAHPNWSMGRKISIDSATLMNKGLEFIEARWLFDMEPGRIEVVIHPQSIIHSMVAYTDGAVMAQLGVPDMKGAISYALSWPQRLPIGVPLPDFAAIASLTFKQPDTRRFPCLSLAFEACREGGTLPAVLNAANEIAVNAFLDGQVAYTDIARLIRSTMDVHTVAASPQLEEILAADRWARETCTAAIGKLARY